MGTTSDRIPCPKCQANNFPTSAVCWQCGESLQAQQDQLPAGPSPSVQPPQQPGPVQPPPSYAPSQPADNTKTLVILGFIFGGLGLLCCPIFSIVGIILGIIAQRRGNSLGIWVIVVSVVTLIIGGILAAAFWTGFMGGFNRALQQGQQPVPFPSPR